MELRAAVFVAVFALSIPLAPAQAPEGLPEGCEEDGGAYLCRFEFSTSEEPLRSFWTFPVPVFARTLATLTVSVEGQDVGWYYGLVEEDGDNRTTLSAHSQPASRAPLARVHRDTSTHLLLANLSREHYLAFNNVGRTTAGNSFVPLLAPTRGEIRITYLAEELPRGRVPERPAATRDDPHLLGAAGDARRAGYDLLAAWLDDREVGDGIFDAHLAVVDLGDLGISPETDEVNWNLTFRVLGNDYVLAWQLTGTDPDPASLTRYCWLGRYAGPYLEILMNPPCEFDFERGLLHSLVPVRAIGNPGEGIPFESLEARVHTHVASISFVEDVTPGLRDEDALLDARFPFALGGEAVWDALNPRLAVRPVPPEPWYRDPLDRENLPDTLQVVGAAAASATFVIGLVVVRRHRALTRRLLRDVEETSRRHEKDAREALLALGRLQTSVANLLHAGKITEAQYQAVSQRIALEATRFALTRELGLDDGEPGDERVRLRT